MKTKDLEIETVSRSMATDVYKVTKNFGIWPNDKDLISLCDPMSSIENPTHFGGVVEETEYPTIKKVTVYTD